jgi:hypothetical protein
MHPKRPPSSESEQGGYLCLTARRLGANPPGPESKASRFLKTGIARNANPSPAAKQLAFGLATYQKVLSK